MKERFGIFKNLIRKAMNEFNWERAFSDLISKEIASVYNTTIKNILVNFILHETIICDDRDPPWINNKIKKINS